MNFGLGIIYDALKSLSGFSIELEGRRGWKIIRFNIITIIHWHVYHRNLCFSQFFQQFQQYKSVNELFVMASLASSFCCFGTWKCWRQGWKFSKTFLTLPVYSVIFMRRLCILQNGERLEKVWKIPALTYNFRVAKRICWKYTRNLFWCSLSFLFQLWSKFTLMEYKSRGTAI